MAAVTGGGISIGSLAMSYVVALTGFPGVGKLTVARSIADSIENSGGIAVIVDNHWVNNPIFGLIEQDGVTPLPLEVWDRTVEVANAVFKTVEDLTPRHWNVIFTVTDTAWLPSIIRIAEQRLATFVPVLLVCDVEENARRIVQPERGALMKGTDPEEAYRFAEGGPMYSSGVANSLTLDVTTLPPTEAARKILRHGSTISPIT